MYWLVSQCISRCSVHSICRCLLYQIGRSFLRKISQCSMYTVHRTVWYFFEGWVFFSKTLFWQFKFWNYNSWFRSYFILESNTREAVSSVYNCVVEDRRNLQLCTLFSFHFCSVVSVKLYDCFSFRFDKALNFRTAIMIETKDASS